MSGPAYWCWDLMPWPPPDTAPEAALTILVPLGLLGLQYFPLLAAIVLLEFPTLYLSYRQTAAAYPQGGG